MQEVKKIKKISLANIVGSLYASVGFLSSLGLSLYSLIKFAFGKSIDKTFFVWFFSTLGLNILISLAVAAGLLVFGWLAGALMAILYNFFAREIGGVKIDLAEEECFKQKNIENNKQDLFKY